MHGVQLWLKMRSLKLPAQCAGLTRKGARCKLTAQSNMLDDRGKLVGEPLAHGGKYCRIHAEIFQHTRMTCQAADHECMLFYIDFETSGLDVLTDNIVEIGLLRHSDGASFQTVVRPPVLPSEGPTVHGISPAELCAGPGFREGFTRMVQFIEACTSMALEQADGDSSDEERCDVAALACVQPRPVLVAHNGFKFDLPILLSECARHKIFPGALENWLFVDTIDLFRSLEPSMTNGCIKLQCLFSHMKPFGGTLAAHRALDDCVCLRGVVQAVADHFGLTAWRLLSPFAVSCNVEASAMQIALLS